MTQKGETTNCSLTRRRIVSNLRLVVLGVIYIFLSPRVAGAETINIRFDTLNEEQPGTICVVGGFVQVQGAIKTKKLQYKYYDVNERKEIPIIKEGQETRISYLPGSNRLKLEKRASTGTNATSNIWDPTITRPSDSNWDDFSPRYVCKPNNFGGREESFAVLHIKDAIVSKVELCQKIATIEVHPGRGEQNKPIQVELIGGSYLKRVSLSLQLVAQTQKIDIPLVPRWVSRRLLRSEFHCDQEEHEPTTKEASVKKDGASDGSYLISLKKAPPQTVTLKECGHEFSYVRREKVPADPIHLQPTQFWFSWKHHCLAPPGKCPAVYWPSSDVTCPQPDKPDERSGLCEYTCSGVTGSAQFPVKGVRLEYSDTQGKPMWIEEVSYPGITVRGYVPPEERRVPLQWAWPKGGASDVDKGALREARAQLPGDELNHLELKTPEGRIHRVHFRTTQIRVPELDCGDYLSYRYIGIRGFEEDDAPVNPSFGITLKDPDTLHESFINIGFMAGAGVRFYPGLSKLWFGPHAEAALYLAFRVLLFKLFDRLFEPELRFGATLSGQPYCSIVSDRRTRSCAEGEWESIPYWKLFLEPGLRYYFAKKWSLGVGLGPAFGFFFTHSDEELVPELVLLTGHLSIAYKIVQSIAIELMEVRFFYGEQYDQTIFDRTGLLASGAIEGASYYSIFLTSMLRWDDLL